MYSLGKRMNEKQVEYNEIYAAVYKLSGAYFTMDDVNSFLSRMDVNKDNSSRFICWMISYHILSPDHDKWATELYNLYQRYGKIIEAHIPDPDRPLQYVQSNSGTVIQCDLMRGINWFNLMANELKLSEFYTSDAEHRITRILCALSLSAHNFSYCQGYDRYMFVVYLLALDFCSQSALPPQFAESVTYFLGNEFIKMTEISAYLENPVKTEEHFLELDSAISAVIPDTMALLTQVQQGSIHFALRWELLLFADEYDIRPLMLLWDQILYMKDRYRDFLFGLCIAHAKQVPLALPDEIMIEKIQQFKSWNVQTIISDAFTYMHRTKSVVKPIDQKKFVLVIAMFLFGMFIMFNLLRD